MCQIIYKQPGKVFNFENILNFVSRSMQYNSDGWGMVYNKINGNGITQFIQMYHGLSLDLEYISKLIKKINVQDCDEIAIHLRQATHGRINLLNCHPFLIGTEQTEWLAYTSVLYPAMMHNGMLLEYEGNNIKSDSCRLAEEISKAIWKNGQLTQFITDNHFRDKILADADMKLACNKYLFILPKITAGIKSIMLGNWYTYGDIMTSSFASELYINGKPSENKQQSKKNGLHMETPNISLPTVVTGFGKKKPSRPLMETKIFSPEVDAKELDELMKTILTNKWNVNDVFLNKSSNVSFWYGLAIIKEILSNGNYSVGSLGSAWTYGIKDDEDLKNCKKIELENYDKVYSAIDNNKKEFDILKDKIMSLIYSNNFKNKIKVHGVGKVPMLTVWYVLLKLNDKFTSNNSRYVGDNYSYYNENQLSHCR